MNTYFTKRISHFINHNLDASTNKIIHIDEGVSDDNAEGY
jgi:hypothetical protein